MLVSSLKATTVKKEQIIINVRSNLHIGQYAGTVSVSPDHSLGQALVAPLVLPGVTRHIKKSFFARPPELYFVSMFLTSCLFCVWFACFIICICLKTSTWLFWDKV